ncbi:MAG: hypothetical protein JXA71_07955 [Chitinispirillaceae bacterium]|nr:hypothetical protein [Chitinispirillaceae bacterium]
MTICIDDPAQKLFGDVVHGKMVENEIAAIIHKWWDDLPDHFNNIGIDEFIVMPNHIHGIIVIRDAIVGTRSSRPTSTHPRITGRDDPDSNGRDDPAQQSGGMTPPLLHSPKP